MTAIHPPETVRAAFMPTPVWAISGVTAVVASFIGLHILHPAGVPEHMSDADLTAWAASGATQIMVGGSIGLAATLLLLVFGEGWAEQLTAWGAATWHSQLARSSTVATAALLGLTSILQVMAGLVATPAERVGQVTFLPTVVNLCGNVAVAVWVLLLPAVAVGIRTERTPTWLKITSAVLALALTATLALPPVSWAPAHAWILITAIGSLLRRPGFRRPPQIRQ
jgi:hypothetical protein